ncbi:hypothetical protein L3X38_036384 [Prunus dulcis]|uniref:Uncharacterized protein n=1 Tax=Prunus dulcis TaxID=3755 RepID=A0AAD4V333_PRUDU|nr:hypothetical protein L3X38_036384 [Prunus dulcis]
MVDLIYRFKCFIPGKKLNLNFVADFPPLPKGITEEMVEEYEGEDTLPKPSIKVVSSYATDGPVNAVGLHHSCPAIGMSQIGVCLLFDMDLPKKAEISFCLRAFSALQPSPSSKQVGLHCLWVKSLPFGRRLHRFRRAQL